MRVPLDLRLFKMFVFQKEQENVRCNTVSHMGLEPTILRSRVHGDSGHPIGGLCGVPCRVGILKYASVACRLFFAHVACRF